MDPATHKRFLDYNERHEYFGAGLHLPKLSAQDFARYDAEHRALVQKGEGVRDDEEEARLGVLAKLLLRD